MQSAFPKVLRSPLEDQAPSEAEPLSDRAWGRGGGRRKICLPRVCFSLCQGNWVTILPVAPKPYPKPPQNQGTKPYTEVPWVTVK